VAGHALEHEQVEAHGRGDLRHLDHDDDEDPEPEQVDAGRADHGLDHRHGEDDAADAVEEAAEHHVEHRQRHDQGRGRQLEAGDEGRQRPGQAGEAHGEREERGAHQDQRDHAGGPHRAHQALGEARARERALGRGEGQRADHPQGGRLGRGREAGVDRAQHHQDQQQHREQETARAQPLRERAWLLGRDGVAVEQAPDGEVAREQAGQDDAGEDAGHEQLRDRFVHRDAVDDEDQRRRDHQPERAGARQGAHDLPLGVAAAAQLGDRHLADRSAGRGGRAADGGEDRAAHDVGVQQAPGQAREPWAQALEHVRREPGAEQDLAHPDE
jgi:hypothetical protein